MNPEVSLNTPKALQLLLFVDERSRSQEQTQQVESYLQTLKEDYPFELQIIEVKERPDLVEHFRLVANPSLVKLFPEPRQVLVGSSLVAQLRRLWQQWKEEAQRQQEVLEKGLSQPDNAHDVENGKNGNGYSPDNIYLTEEIFRLKKENQELREQLQFKDQVVAMLAHDLRSPLTAASIAVETLELAQNQPDSEKASELMGQLYKQARTQFRVMNRMITDILQTAKGASSLNLKLQNVHLPDLCEDIFQQFTESLTTKALNFEKDVPQDIPPVYADAELIRQVLTNLIENAIKYTPEQGTLSVSVLHRTTQKVQISVSDTGPGIPEEQQEQIFDGHFRLKRDEAKEGYGIGLSLCRQIIQAHYGQIWVDSVPNFGSSFHFTLPVYR
ncbi:histidine kinase [Spirulina sp. CS-785/01]|uniref:histidine kinase n=1 Tax=Spirulina sp. CS-785/01 TaxID=3021716 RepID=UPI003FA72E33